MITNHFFIFLFLALIKPIFCFAQQNKQVDSLEMVLKTYTQQDTTFINLLNDLSFEYHRDKPDTGLLYANQALQLAQKLDYQRGICRSYISIAWCDFEASRYEKAIEGNNQAEILAKQLNDNKLLIRIYHNLGWIYNRQANFDKSLSLFVKAANLAEKSQDLKTLSAIYNGMSGIYQRQKEYDKSIAYLSKSIEINLKRKNESGLASNYNNLGINYLFANRYEEALKYYFLARDLHKKLNQMQGLAIILNNIGLTYYRKGEAQKALAYYLESVEINKKYKNKQLASWNHNGLGGVYRELKKYDLAEKSLKYSLELSQETGSKDLEKDAYELFFLLYREQKQFEKSLIYHEKFKQLNDSLFSNEKTKYIAQMQTVYETEKKDNENKLLKKDNLLQQENARKQVYLLIAILGAFFTALFFSYFFYKNKKKEQKLNEDLQLMNEEILTHNEELKQQQEEIIAQRDYIEFQNTQLNETNQELQTKDLKLSFAYSQITKSIGAAQQIQEALLPFNERLVDIFADIFVLYRPKDIVSGDFYLVEQHEDKTFVAVFDCTGHGVPGAFMSLIGFVFLNEIIFIKELSSPSEILSALSQEIWYALKQDKTDSREGMDIAICCITQTNKQEFEVVFAGSKRPLWYSESNTQIINEIKGNKTYVGGFLNLHQNKFTDHQILLTKGSKVYLSSDGYADQPDVKRSKIGSEKMKSLLTSNLQQTMKKQREVLVQYLDEHQAKGEQRDDILVMGFEL